MPDRRWEVPWWFPFVMAQTDKACQIDGGKFHDDSYLVWHRRYQTDARTDSHDDSYLVWRKTKQSSMMIPIWYGVRQSKVPWWFLFDIVTGQKILFFFWRRLQVCSQSLSGMVPNLAPMSCWVNHSSLLRRLAEGRDRLAPTRPLSPSCLCLGSLEK